MLIKKHWIIFRFPNSQTQSFVSANEKPAQKTTITGWWHTKNRWYQETSSVIWKNPEDTITQILNYWFETAQQEKCIQKRCACRNCNNHTCT